MGIKKINSHANEYSGDETLKESFFLSIPFSFSLPVCGIFIR
jgi:hypothetical protein